MGFLLKASVKILAWFALAVAIMIMFVGVQKAAAMATTAATTVGVAVGVTLGSLPSAASGVSQGQAAMADDTSSKQ